MLIIPFQITDYVEKIKLQPKLLLENLLFWAKSRFLSYSLIFGRASQKYLVKVDSFGIVEAVIVGITILCYVKFQISIFLLQPDQNIF